MLKKVKRRAETRTELFLFFVVVFFNLKILLDCVSFFLSLFFHFGSLDVQCPHLQKKKNNNNAMPISFLLNPKLMFK